MGVAGIQWQTVNLPFAAGLQQKADDRARPQPFLDICNDAQFDELGGTQPRLPFATTAGAVFGGGTISGARRIVRNGNETVLFTSDSVYAWNAQLAKWVLRGTHLAISVDETTRFATAGDQIEGDRAELNGTVVYAWNEGGVVFAAALDKTTGAVLMAPFSIIAASQRPRLVALATKIMFFVEANATGLLAYALDPADPSAALVGGTSVTVAAAAVFNSYYDVVKVDSQDLVVGVYRRDTTTSYSVFTVTPALVVTTSTKARTADGPVAIATVPGGGLQTQVIRQNIATAIQGDFLTTSTLADLTINQAVFAGAAAQVNQLTAAYRSVQNAGAFRCYVFASTEAASDATGTSVMNFVDTAGTIGTSAQFIRQLGVASRAFSYNGSVYLWMAFAGISTVATLGPFTTPALALQNTYFLYRDDSFLCAKSMTGRAGGFSATRGHLPGVALTSGTTVFTWCGTERRRIELGTGDVSFAARVPSDMVFTFDTNKARRTARLGRTLYISGGEILQYDGVRLTEVGFHIYPWLFGIIDAGGGSVATGTYSYKQTFRCPNAQGETDRSTTATIASITNSSSSLSVLTSTPLTVTHKTSVVPAAEFWRTLVAPNADSPFFLVSSNDPAALTNPNRYVPNSTTVTTLPTFNDFLADANVSIREANPENGATLENICPPPAKIIIATDTRLFLAGVAGDPDRVWYSRLRGNNEVASFNDVLVFDVPRVGDDEITCVWFDANGVFYAARRTAIFAFSGQGKDNDDQGQNFTLSRIVSEDVGVLNHESVALTPKGVILKSAKGWQLLHGNGDLEFIGAGVSDFDAEEVLSVDVVETQHHVRILTAARMIVWDYLINQWEQWTIADGLHSCVVGGAQVYLTATGTRTQQTDYTGLTYGLDVETAFIKLADLQGAARCRKLQPLGEVRSACLVRMRVGYNYKPGYVDDVVCDVSGFAAGDPLQLKLGPKRPICESIKLRITAVTDAVRATIAVTSVSFSVATSGTAWTATLRSSVLTGEHGNLLSLSAAFETTTGTFSIDVRDHFAWSIAEQRWTVDENNVGLHVLCRSGSSPTVAQLEAAINAGSALAAVSVADVTPTKVVDATALAGVTRGPVSFSGGLFGSPTGEGIKLTSLGLEVGTERGLFKRIASGVTT